MHAELVCDSVLGFGDLVAEDLELVLGFEQIFALCLEFEDCLVEISDLFSQGYYLIDVVSTAVAGL